MVNAMPAPTGYMHEAAVYGSDEELVHVVVPLLEEGVTTGQPTMAALLDHETALVRTALRNPDAVTFLPPLTSGERPPATLLRLTSMLGELAARGAQQIRVVNTMPHPGLGAPWDGWCRYEAAINDVLAELPVWGVCLYDRRITPDEVLDHVERTHPHLALNGDHLSNDRYEDPKAFVLSLTPPPDPLQGGLPAVEMLDPTPAASRHAVEDIASRTWLAPEEVERLVIAISEAVTNAILHGRPPVTVKVWASAERMVVTVHDRGEGPQGAQHGLVPGPNAASGGGGYGLWLIHQLLPITYHREEGFTIRLTAGRTLA
jgi:anti-sigma regulatory factor (Ser/Thr protein kinase)